MSEEQIIQIISNVCQDRSIHFQIIVQDSILHVYINRQTDIDYQLITRQIYVAVSSIKGMTFYGIYLHSRILGEVEPDWQVYLAIKEPSEAALDSINYLATEITTEIDNTNTFVEEIKYESKAESLVKNIVDQVENTSSLVSKLKKQLSAKTFDSLAEELEEDSTGEIVSEVKNQNDSVNSTNSQLTFATLDFSEYCFISDKNLLNAKIAPLTSNLAKLINIFDEFAFSIKRLQLSTLETYFMTEQHPNLDGLDKGIKAWWAQILQLNTDNQHQLALWLSHYCQDRAKIMSMIKTIYRIESAAETQLFLGLLLIETAMINHNKALIYFCLSHS